MMDEYNVEWLMTLAGLPSEPDAVLFEAWVDGEPKPKGRPRMNTRTGKAYTPKDTRQYERRVADELGIAMQGREPLTGDIEVILDFYRQNNVRADIDNMIKAVADSANGIVYDDDKQIVSLQARVVYGSATPGTRVRISAARAA
jgi:Holliday junction resolvase RusA-like endonuclease